MINTKINLLMGIFFLLFFRVCFSEAQISSSNCVPAANALPATTSASSMTAYRDRFYLATYDMTNQLGGCSYIYSYQSFNQLKNVSNGMYVVSPYTSCPDQINTLTVHIDNFGHSLLYASGTRIGGGAFVYQFNGDINHPNWTEDDSGIPQTPYHPTQITGFSQ